MKNSFMQFYEFLNNGKEIDATYLTDNVSYQIYVRKSSHTINGEHHKTFDLSNIHYTETGTGEFTKLLEKIEVVIGKSDRKVYIENIIPERFIKFFEKRGYEIEENQELPSAILK